MEIAHREKIEPGTKERREQEGRGREVLRGIYQEASDRPVGTN